MVIATTELLLTTVRMKGGIKGMPMVASTSAGVLCRRTFSVPWLSAPVAGTLCSRFSTGVLIRRNHSSLRSRDGGVGFTGAICTIGTYYPTRSSWGCKVKPTNHILSSFTNLTYLLLIGSLMLWKVTRTKKMKDWFAFFLLSVCIWLGLSAAKGNGQAAYLVALCEQAGKVYKVLGHLGLM